MICAVCDSILIAVGVTGMGAIIASSGMLSIAAGFGGVLFLFFYGINAFKSAFKGEKLSADQKTAPSLKMAVITTLALTLLNPHVYIDTIILLGSIASQFPRPGHIIFGIGAMTASFIWFFSLSFGGRLLAPVFAKDIVWRILDALIGITMWAIAFSVGKGLIPA